MRKVIGYEQYGHLKFSIPVGQAGDSYDRYLVRLYEMYESCAIIDQCIKNFDWSGMNVLDMRNVVDAKLTGAEREASRYGMEDLIAHFKLYSESFSVN